MHVKHYERKSDTDFNAGGTADYKHPSRDTIDVFRDFLCN